MHNSELSPPLPPFFILNTNIHHFSLFNLFLLHPTNSTGGLGIQSSAAYPNSLHFVLPLYLPSKQEGTIPQFEFGNQSRNNNAAFFMKARFVRKKKVSCREVKKEGNIYRKDLVLNTRNNVYFDARISIHIQEFYANFGPDILTQVEGVLRPMSSIFSRFKLFQKCYGETCNSFFFNNFV